MYTSLWIFPFHQNVLWTFLLSLLCLKRIDKLRERLKVWLWLPLAVLALLPIWLYKGEQGPHNKAIQYCLYAFYPVHMLILGLL